MTAVRRDRRAARATRTVQDTPSGWPLGQSPASPVAAPATTGASSTAEATLKPALVGEQPASKCL
jgi:hypothetical protein